MKFASGDLRFDTEECREEDIEALSDAVARFFRKRGTERIYLGYDTRLSTPFIRDRLAEALCANGIDVIMPESPISSCLFYWNCLEGDTTGIMVTASHNPGNWNGLKMVESDLCPISSEAVGALIDIPMPEWTGPRGTVSHADRKESYIDRIIRISGISPDAEASLLVDFLHGVNGPEIMSCLKRFPGIRVKALHEDMDGAFPAGDPNPLSESSIAPFRKELSSGEYDLGFVFDGDGDRTAVFSPDGTRNESYALLPLIASFLSPSPKLLSDAKTPLTHLKAGMGLCRTGHANFKRMMRDSKEDGYTAAAEGSGHFFYSLDKDGRTVILESSLLTMLLTVRAYTEERERYDMMEKSLEGCITLPELSVRFSDPDRVMAQVKEHFRAHGAELFEEDASGNDLRSLIIKMDDYQIYQHASETERGLVRWQIIEYRKGAAKNALRYLQCFS